MKRFIAVALVLLFTVACFSADVRIAWDPATEAWDFVRIFRRASDGTTWAQVAQVPGTAVETVLTLPTGRHFLMARSVVGDLESENSNEVEAVIRPGKPTIRITVK